ncbi:MAG: tRNA (N(6)-L-threonylcarbamoyladenosine(37)-C(2))-methylthiotransferase MtaB, partial [Bacteroidetes bacterium]|nr:tRNA (N(6)-L-threonylcarbamoyladenosine(37)-C(2))-methylthiotransferase MtaB [Bacteroidota bacterium]
MRHVALHTLGCKLNFAETSTIGRQFVENGFHTVPFSEEAEVYVLNTCTVSHKADRECRQIIRSVLRKRPGAFVIVAGCYAQLRPEEIASIDGVDVVLGTKDKYKIFELVKNFGKGEYPKIFVSEMNGDDDFGPAFSGDTDNRTRAFLKVQDGCDYKCSFCTIPLARGQSRSQSIELSVSQAQSLAAKGFKEIVLSGVNVGDYGGKIDTNLFSLLKELVKVKGIERIRMGSIESNLLSH